MLPVKPSFEAHTSENAFGKGARRTFAFCPTDMYNWKLIDVVKLEQHKMIFQ